MPLSIDAFPNSIDEPFIAKSPFDPRYNCIGWACGSKSKFWPNTYGYTLPNGIPAKLHINSFVELFKSRGYEECDDGELEKGFLKIAIYVDSNDKPSHAARQLPSGVWTSKLGFAQDIEHSIHSMANGQYGDVKKYMKKPI